MNSLKYYPRYPRDFLEGTAGMPLDLKGPYSILIDLFYLMGARGLPDDAGYISGQLGCSVRKWNSIKAKLIEKGKIRVEGDLIVNGRAEIEKKKQRDYQLQQGQNGAGGAAKEVEEKDLQRDYPEINGGLSGGNLEINGSKSGDNLPEKEVAHNENNNLENRPPTDDIKPEPDTDTNIGGPGERASAQINQPPEFRERLLVAMGHDPTGLTATGKLVGNFAQFSELKRLMGDLDLSETEVIAIVSDISRAKPDGPANSFSYFTEPLRRFAGTKQAPPTEPIIPENVTHIRGQPYASQGPTSDTTLDAIAIAARMR